MEIILVSADPGQPHGGNFKVKDQLRSEATNIKRTHPFRSLHYFVLGHQIFCNTPFLRSSGNCLHCENPSAFTICSPRILRKKSCTPLNCCVSMLRSHNQTCSRTSLILTLDLLESVEQHRRDTESFKPFGTAITTVIVRIQIWN